MKLLIAGSRNMSNIDISPYIPADTDRIISGGAKGIDTLAEKYADEHNIPKVILRPQYDLFGRAAPLVRDREMVDMCDKVLAFWDQKSRGTKYTIDYANKTGKPVEVIII